MSMDIKVTWWGTKAQRWFDDLDDAIAWAEAQAFEWIKQGSISSPEYQVIYNPSGSIQRRIKTCAMGYVLHDHSWAVGKILEHNGERALVRFDTEYMIGGIKGKRFEEEISFGSEEAARKHWVSVA